MCFYFIKIALYNDFYHYICKQKSTMKTTLKTIFVIALLLLETFSSSNTYSNNFNYICIKSFYTKLETKAKQISMICEFEHYDFSIYVSALTYIESRNDKNALNKNTGAAGLFQEMKVQVDEANRILGYQKYQYDDRFNHEKATEIFYIIQKRYNKKLSIRKAIKLHNPNAGFWYAKLIYNKMKQIKNEKRNS